MTLGLNVGLGRCLRAVGASLSVALPVAKCEQAREQKRVAYAASYPANNPIEDRSAAREEGAVKLYGVFDGHGGWQMAEYAHRRLLAEVQTRYEQQKTYVNYFTTPDRERKLDGFDNMEKVLLSSFSTVEKEFLEKTREAFPLGFVELAKVGSCVLLAAHKGDLLYLANCGDCRAVLGSQGPGAAGDADRHYATRLTHDHNARVALEALQLRLSHPGEENIIVCKSPTACYVKGRLQLTRALGDLYLKYPEFNAPPSQHRSMGRHIPPPYTPPYVSPVPEVTQVRLQPEDCFLVLATDGLWDEMSDQEAVSVVSQCIKAGKRHEAAGALVEESLARAAAASGMAVAELKALPPGNRRRGRHDDTTAVVIFFHQN